MLPLQEARNAAPDGMTLTNISLILESKTVLRLYFTNIDTTASDIIEAYTDEHGNPAEHTFSAKTKGSEIYYDITGFAPGEIFASRTLHFADSSDNFAVTIGNYANWAVSGDDIDLKNTILALYNYDEYAKAYKDENYVPVRVVIVKEVIESDEKTKVHTGRA